MTLGVDDLDRARRFAEALGWTGGQQVEETAFFQAGGQAVVVWSREELAADVGITDEGGSFGGIALAHNVRSAQDVDRVVREAAAAGAEVTRAPDSTFYGGSHDLRFAGPPATATSSTETAPPGEHHATTGPPCPTVPSEPACSASPP